MVPIRYSSAPALESRWSQFYIPALLRESHLPRSHLSHSFSWHAFETHIFLTRLRHVFFWHTFETRISADTHLRDTFCWLTFEENVYIFLTRLRHTSFWIFETHIFSQMWVSKTCFSGVCQLKMYTFSSYIFLTRLRHTSYWIFETHTFFWHMFETHISADIHLRHTFFWHTFETYIFPTRLREIFSWNTFETHIWIYTHIFKFFVFDTHFPDAHLREFRCVIHISRSRVADFTKKWRDTKNLRGKTTYNYAMMWLSVSYPAREWRNRTPNASNWVLVVWLVQL